MKSKITITFAFVAIILSGIIYSCSSNNDDFQATTTVAQDKENIKNTFNDFYGCLNKLDDGDLSNFLLYSLFNTTDNTYNDSYLKSLSDKFEFQYGDIIMNDKVQFATLTGVYSWNNTTQLWTKTANSSSIILKFPSRQNQSVLDSELALNSYSDVQTTFTSDIYWLPSAANLTLKRNSNTVFSLALTNVSFQTGTNFSMPLSANISIYTAPFTHTFQWTRTSPTDFKLVYNSSTTNGCLSAIEVNVKLQDSDYANITSVEEDVKNVNGFISEGNLKINYAVNVQALSVYTDPTDNQINANSDAEVFYNGLKIGDLEYRTINGKAEIFIIYSDGSTENVDVHIGDFQQKVETIFSNYIN